ncbi:MAG: hypothetical protein M1320_00655 [Patescibacteria group bacterium]|nr:hypothetical protein [Patescibacteria group bacterium]
MTNNFEKPQDGEKDELTMDSQTPEEIENNRNKKVDMQLDPETGTMITQEEYLKKMKERLDNPFDNAAKQ